MTWIWPSWEGFVETVNPFLLVSQGAHLAALRASKFENLQQLMQAVTEFRAALDLLDALGFRGQLHEISHAEFVETERTHEAVTRLVRAGEDLLFRHHRLAKTDHAYGYLHQHGILRHWPRFDKNGTLPYEVTQLVRDAKVLLRGFEQIAREDEGFLLAELDLPDELAADFCLARDLFSVGFDRTGLLISGRGLEGVLRGLSDMHELTLATGGKETPLSTVGLFDLIEGMHHCRHAGSGERLIDHETRQLLHYLRSARNAGAHLPSTGGTVPGSPRDLAALVAKVATQIWGTNGHLDDGLRNTVIQKSW